MQTRVSTLVLVNKVALHQARLLLGLVTEGKQSRSVTNHLSQLSHSFTH